VTSPVMQLQRDFHRADRMPLRIVPPTRWRSSQDKRSRLQPAEQPFDVLLRVHSYATQAGEVRAGLTVPRGWKTGAAVPLKFEEAGDRYARLT